ncbi:MAG: response regulator [Proteobacteria bacterium]|nr:response regulator [Pseudomonadota bacterium]
MDIQDENNLHILVVDDDENVLEMLIESGIELGFQVSSAQDGHAALKMCEDQEFDAIFSDIMMPVMNGLDFLAQLRAQGKETPVVLVTGAGLGRENTLAAVRLGAFDFIEKPWSMVALRDTMCMASEFGMRQRRVKLMLAIPESERTSHQKHQLEIDQKFLMLGPVVHNKKRAASA